jgi:hypothetical protein
MDFQLFTPVWRWSLVCIFAAAPLITFAATPPDATSFGKPVPDNVLAHHRGGHAITFNQQHLDANLYDNQAAYNLTGSNQVSGHAFANTSGVPTVIQNSGNNVIIQNATVLNVHVQ